MHDRRTNRSSQPPVSRPASPPCTARSTNSSTSTRSRDAAVVVDVPGFGRQVLHAGRRPLRNDEQGLHAAEPGLYLDPPVDDPVLDAARCSRSASWRCAIDAGAACPLVSIVSLDELELELRRLAGVSRSASWRPTSSWSSSSRPGPTPYDELAARRHRPRGRARRGPVAVEVVRWGDGGPHQAEARLRLVDVTTDPGAGELTVRLARGDEEALGRASTARRAPRCRRGDGRRRPHLPPRAHLPPGVGPHRRDHPRPAVPRGRVGHRPAHPHPSPRRRRGRHAHRGGGPRHPRRPQPHHQPRPLTPSRTGVVHGAYDPTNDAGS